MSECKDRNLNISITYQKINDISIEIYTGYQSSYQMVYYADGFIKLKKAIKEAHLFLKDNRIKT